MIPTDWEQSYVYATIWNCGDDDCQCYQPRIYRSSPNLKVGRPWRIQEMLWEGTFASFGDFPLSGATHESLEAELREAVKAYPEAVWGLPE